MIRSLSKTRAAQLRQYTKLRKAYLEQHRVCAVTGYEATEVHHKRGRFGARLLQVEYWLPVSRAGHMLIHENPKRAYEKGWLIRR